MYNKWLYIYTCLASAVTTLLSPVVYASLQVPSTDNNASYDYVPIETEVSPVLPRRQVQKPASRRRLPPSMTNGSDEDDPKLYPNPAYFTVSRTSPH